MKYLGGVILLAYAAILFLGFEPFASDERGKLPPDARRAPGGVLIWHSGTHGGK